MASPKVNKIYEFGPFFLDAGKRLLYREGQLLPLPPKVVETLLILVESSGSVVDKETLLSSVWPDTFVDENNLAQNISVLRRALGSGDSRIETIPKRGYRLIAPVRTPEPPRIVELPEGPPAPGPGLQRRTKWIAAIFLVAALAAAAFFVKLPPSAVRAMAVLPLQNLSGDPQDEYLADGLTELLISDLAKVGSIRVISRTSSMHFKNTRMKLPEIASELKVDALLEGSVLRSGDRIRVTVQLIRGATDARIWSKVYEQDIRDLSDLQVDIALTIAHEAGLQMDGQTRHTERRPLNREAFEEYLRGRHAWNKRSPAEIQKAIAHFEKAIDLDAAYSLPYAGLADAYNQLGTHLIGERRARETRPLAIAAALKTIEIDPESAEAHAALGYARMYDWDWPQAELELRRAIELNPSYAPVRLWYAAYLQQNGKHREAIDQAHKALELDPLSLIVRTQVGWTYAHAGDFSKAFPYFQDVVQQDPANLWGQWQLGQAYMYTGKYPEAIEVLERAAAGYQRAPALLGTLGAAYALAGRRRDAEKLIEELNDLSKRRYVSAHAFTWIYLGLGDRDRAFESMRHEYEDRSNCVAWHPVWRLLDGLRSDPRYLELMSRIGLSHTPVAPSPKPPISLSDK
jgi:TolB-like protein/DNA-binding winged helix-turn-helix (wHTH) protein/Flp pilus assembly protein TadD